MNRKSVRYVYKEKIHREHNADKMDKVHTKIKADR